MRPLFGKVRISVRQRIWSCPVFCACLRRERTEGAGLRRASHSHVSAQPLTQTHTAPQCRRHAFRRTAVQPIGGAIHADFTHQRGARLG